MSDFLGTGLLFPFQATERGTLALVTGLEKLKQNVAKVCRTQRGTVYCNLDLGWPKDELIFIAETEVLTDLIELFLTEAIEEQEPRVTVEEFLFDSPEPGKLMVQIFCKTRDGNDLFYYVFPFYRQNGAQ